MYPTRRFCHISRSPFFSINSKKIYLPQLIFEFHHEEYSSPYETIFQVFLLFFQGQFYFISLNFQFPFLFRRSFFV